MSLALLDAADRDVLLSLSLAPAGMLPLKSLLAGFDWAAHGQLPPEFVLPAGDGFFIHGLAVHQVLVVALVRDRAAPGPAILLKQAADVLREVTGKPTRVAVEKGIVDLHVKCARLLLGLSPAPKTTKSRRWRRSGDSFSNADAAPTWLHSHRPPVHLPFEPASLDVDPAEERNEADFDLSFGPAFVAPRWAAQQVRRYSESEFNGHDESDHEQSLEEDEDYKDEKPFKAGGDTSIHDDGEEYIDGQPAGNYSTIKVAEPSRKRHGGAEMPQSEEVQPPPRKKPSSHSDSTGDLAAAELAAIEALGALEVGRSLADSLSDSSSSRVSDVDIDNEESPRVLDDETSPALPRQELNGSPDQEAALSSDGFTDDYDRSLAHSPVDGAMLHQSSEEGDDDYGSEAVGASSVDGDVLQTTRQSLGSESEVEPPQEPPPPETPPSLSEEEYDDDDVAPPSSPPPPGSPPSPPALSDDESARPPAQSDAGLSQIAPPSSPPPPDSPPSLSSEEEEEEDDELPPPAASPPPDSPPSLSEEEEEDAYHRRTDRRVADSPPLTEEEDDVAAAPPPSSPPPSSPPSPPSSEAEEDDVASPSSPPPIESNAGQVPSPAMTVSSAPSSTFSSPAQAVSAKENESSLLGASMLAGAAAGAMAALESSGVSTLPSPPPPLRDATRYELHVHEEAMVMVNRAGLVDKCKIRGKLFGATPETSKGPMNLLIRVVPALQVTVVPSNGVSYDEGSLVLSTKLPKDTPRSPPTLVALYSVGSAKGAKLALKINASLKYLDGAAYVVVYAIANPALGVNEILDLHLAVSLGQGVDVDSAVGDPPAEWDADERVITWSLASMTAGVKTVLQARLVSRRGRMEGKDTPLKAQARFAVKGTTMSEIVLQSVANRDEDRLARKCSFVMFYSVDA